MTKLFQCVFKIQVFIAVFSITCKWYNWLQLWVLTFKRWYLTRAVSRRVSACLHTRSSTRFVMPLTFTRGVVIITEQCCNEKANLKLILGFCGVSVILYSISDDNAIVISDSRHILGVLQATQAPASLQACA